MNVLVACEFSGIVREAFRARGHDAWSCDLLPAADGSEHHFKGDVRPFLGPTVDLLIAHPPCTYLNSAGLHWITRGRIEADGRARVEHQKEALAFVVALWTCGAKRICIENPQGCINTKLDFMPKPQYIQPYQFGDDASKKTGLWLRNLPPLVIDPAKRVAGRNIDGKERWGNQTDSGQNRLGPSPDRALLRSTTYPGIAAAMAEQWGNL